jgi:preprotein translocase subunit Sec63
MWKENPSGLTSVALPRQIFARSSSMGLVLIASCFDLVSSFVLQYSCFKRFRITQSYAMTLN